MNTAVPPGTCLIHGSFTGSSCPSCSTAAPIQNQFSGYFAIIPQYKIRFTIPARADIPARAETFLVSEPDLDSFIKILLANGISTFEVKSAQEVS